MSVTTERPTATSLTQPGGPRLSLPPDRPGATLLDGGWWPRSADPAAELPGLILAIEMDLAAQAANRVYAPDIPAAVADHPARAAETGPTAASWRSAGRRQLRDRRSERF